MLKSSLISKVILLLLWSSGMFSGCTLNTAPTAPTKAKGLDPELLLAFNAQKAQEQDELLHILAPDSMGYEDLGGLRIRWSSRAESTSKVLHTDGVVVEWTGKISLTDGQVRIQFEEDDPLVFVIGFSDWPMGFHDIARVSQVGDHLDAWIPAALAWGLTGLPPNIPQDAMVHVDIEVKRVHSTSTT
jgi:FKBP-type peptidyl-prolyl cis-trans isomerase